MVNIYKSRFTLLQQDILSFLFDNAGKSFNARNLAKSLEVSQTAISKALPGLVKEELVKVEKDKISGRLSIELNRDNRRVINIKRVSNLKEIYESGLLEFLYEKFPSATIVLFGSFSFGEDTIDSDMDIAIIGAKEMSVNLKNFSKRLHKEIFLHFYESLIGVNKNLKENILNGIVLKGGIEL